MAEKKQKKEIKKMTNLVNKVTACGNVLKAEHKGWEIQTDEARSYVQILDYEGRCGNYTLENGSLVFQDGEEPSDWTDEDWSEVEAAICSAA